MIKRLDAGMMDVCIIPIPADDALPSSFGFNHSCFGMPVADWDHNGLMRQKISDAVSMLSEQQPLPFTQLGGVPDSATTFGEIWRALRGFEYELPHENF